jgi:hypothetical protein
VSSYTLLNRYPPSSLVKIASRQALALLLRLMALPFVVLVLLAERGADRLTVVAGSVPAVPSHIVATTTTAYLDTWRTR